MGRWGRARPDALLMAAFTEAPSPRGEAAAPRTDTPFAVYPEGAAPHGYPPGPPSAFPGKSPAFPLRKPSRCDRPKQGDGYPAIFFPVSLPTGCARADWSSVRKRCSRLRRGWASAWGCGDCSAMQERYSTASAREGTEGLIFCSSYI